MLGKFVIVFASALFFLIFVPAQVSADTTIWTPSKILSKQQYHGLIMIDENTDSDTTFDVITDNEETLHIVTEKVTIPKGKHHGIITLETKGTGTAKIFAIHKDILLEQTIQIVESAGVPTKIDLIMPTSLVDVLTENNAKKTGYVFLINDFDNPVVAQEPVPITLTSNGDVLLPKNTVTIEPGSHYAKFSFETKGEGSVTATAQNLEPDTSNINVSDPTKIELHMEIAPNPVPTSSSAEVYYWLERDDKPYLPTHDIKLIITIDKSTHLSFDSVIKGALVLSSSTSDRKTTDPDAKTIITRSDAQLLRDSTKEFILKKGSYYGRATVYTSFESGDISINGLAESIDPQKDEEYIKAIETLRVTTQKSTSGKPLQTKVFAYPDPAYDKLEIIVSSQTSGGPTLEGDNEDFRVFVDDKLDLQNTMGQIKTNENYGIIVANVKDIGTSKIFGQRNEIAGEEKEVQIKNKYVRDPDLEIIPLPVIFGVQQDLFLISSSHNKIITNPDSSTGENLISITSRPSFDYQVNNDDAPVIKVSGTISDLLEEDPVVHIASNAFTATETLEVYNPSRNKIESMHPDTVYVGEPFPIVNHVTDLDGNPLRRADLKVSSSVNMGTIGELVYFNQSGTHGIIFYDKNTVPIESIINVAGTAIESIQEQSSQEQAVVPVIAPTLFTYDVIVNGGQGSGSYPEGVNVTISAPAVIDDMFVIKKKLVGWENLPYKEPTVTFEADSDIETKPIYQPDFTMLLLAGGSGVGVGSAIVFKKKFKKIKKDDDSLSEEEKMIDELLEK